MTSAAAALAVSDLLVMTALDRAGSRVMPRAVRSAVPADGRYRVHERYAVPQAHIDRAMAGAWALCPLLASRHRLPVDLADWIAALDGYTRSLLLMSEVHTTSQLAGVVERVLSGDVRVGGGLTVVR